MQLLNLLLPNRANEMYYLYFYCRNRSSSTHGNIFNNCKNSNFKLHVEYYNINHHVNAAISHAVLQCEKKGVLSCFWISEMNFMFHKSRYLGISYGDK